MANLTSSCIVFSLPPTTGSPSASSALAFFLTTPLRSLRAASIRTAGDMLLGSDEKI